MFLRGHLQSFTYVSTEGVQNIFPHSLFFIFAEKFTKRVPEKSSKYENKHCFCK